MGHHDPLVGSGLVLCTFRLTHAVPQTYAKVILDAMTSTQGLLQQKFTTLSLLILFHPVFQIAIPTFQV